MYKKKWIKLMGAILAFMLVLSNFSGCGKLKDKVDKDEEKKQETILNSSIDKKTERSNGEITRINETAKISETTRIEDLPWLEYTVFAGLESSPRWVEGENDIMSQIIEDRFRIKLKDYYFNQGMSFKERMNLFIAVNDIPDVVFTINDGITAPSTGRYAVLGDLIKENCPNYMKFVPEEQWRDALFDGKMYCITQPKINPDDPIYRDNITIYADNYSGWGGFWTRESILKKTGHSFTPMVEFEKRYEASGYFPTLEDLKIEPQINTPDEFYDFLKRIKSLNLKVNGLDVIPFTMPIFLIPHFGAMFGVTGGWKYNPETKKVSQFLGDEHAKDYWKYINKLYNEGLLDKDFLIQKTEQLQEKGITGRVAISYFFPNHFNIQEVIRQDDPNDSLRYIPLPMQPGTTYVGIDNLSQTTAKFFISNDFEDIPRLLRYFDWFLSDEAVDLISWGPKEFGLWDIINGKKFFKDETYYRGLSGTGTREDVRFVRTNYFQKGFYWNARSTYNSVVPQCPYSMADWRGSYPQTLFEPMERFFWYTAAPLARSSNEWEGYISLGVNELTQKIVDWTYGEFEQQYSARLFTPKTEEEFEKNWNEMMKHIEERMQYSKAKKDMEEVFRMRGFGVISD